MQVQSNRFPCPTSKDARRARLAITKSAIVALLHRRATSLDGQTQITKGGPARVAVLNPFSPPEPGFEAFRGALRELGYVEGQNLVFEVRWAHGRLDRLPEL